ncbi:DNA helicase IV [Xenorhabdus bovienii]|uniref:DNA helicase IV n=1 Tax=Xenorhabdus bovienii TaxID=40576 RepID=UPI0023B2ADA5|nr:DNA helicase IV [Xenorhabdus bovienii]MDE9495756.1 DNA helicase IV [Xenorhabdus bovienii]MDE9504158.1 DNA helicase IV [Xenorhabdus bovienii]MDE9527834.1 DNA helicase IV [Xenorhabdus bovienii]MDE9571020.1 DNA helicase IV [Xenorhabdus bovienii]
MELKSTQMGQRLAQHPYNRVRLLNAGIEVSGDKHQYLIPFNQLMSIQCKRGIVWGELEFELHEGKVVRLHGTEWQQTQHFYHYLLKEWQQWSLDMSDVSADVLAAQVNEINKITQQDRWFKTADLLLLQQQIQEAFQALPLPLARIEQFENCRDDYLMCLDWLDEGGKTIKTLNQQWVERILQQYAEFFQTIEITPLNRFQCQAVVNGEKSILVLAGAGSGKTSVLVARAGWLLLRQQALPEQVLLLAFGRQAADEMNKRIQKRLGTKEIQAKTFHALALHIIQQGSHKAPKMSELETDAQKRRDFLIKEWQKQCSEKKVQAKGWREWLNQELDWQLPEGEYWHDKQLTIRLSDRLERWLELMRMHGGSQKEMIEQASPTYADAFQKRIRLMAPLLKVWKLALKSEGAVDFSGLIHQAVNILEKGRFISPWKHILVDEFQDISPLRAKLLAALRVQNKQSHLFAVGDDWQAIYRFSGAELTLTTAFSTYFGEGAESAECTLDTTYRFNDRIGEIANRFIRQNPNQLNKPLNSLTKGTKKSVVILPQEQLEALLNKMSGYVTKQETILLLGRYHYLKPEFLKKASTRWPNLNIEFMTIHASKGHQSDYVIILGLQQGQDGFPAPARESVLEQVLLPQPEDFPDAEERRLLYVALTRVKKQVWLMQEPKNPSVFIHQLTQLGVPTQRKP